MRPPLKKPLTLKPGQYNLTVNMIDAVQALGRKVDSLWKKKSITGENFSRISSDLLRKWAFHRQFDLKQLLDWLATCKKFPQQYSLASKFGHPPLTLYWGKKFFIDLYFWVSPDIAIHSHDFDGAFTVLYGKSFYCQYHFSPKERIGKQVFFGNLGLEKAGLLQRGSVCEIRSGTSFIHQVWHMSYPTISLALRTLKSRNVVQYTYLEPHFAFPTHFPLKPQQRRQLQVLLMLHRTRHPSEESYFLKLLSMVPTDDAFLISAHYLQMLDVATLNRTPEKALGIRKWLPFLVSYFKQLSNTNCHFELIHDEGERFLLALLHTLSSRKQILNFVGQYISPGSDRAKTVIRWLRNMEGKLGFVLNQTTSEILYWILNDYEEKQICDQILHKYPKTKKATVLRDVQGIILQMKSYPLLKPLVS